MAKTKAQAARPPLLPPQAADFLRKAGFKLLSGGLVLAALALVLALVSYDPGDPSLNTASSKPVANLMGLNGAFSADLLLQSIGLVSGLLPLILLGWAVRTWRQQLVTSFPLRVLLGLLALFMLAIGLNAISPPTDWPLRAGLGGVAGTLFSDRVLGLFALIDPALAGKEANYILSGLMALGGLGLLGWCIGLAVRDWMTLAASVVSAPLALFRSASSTFEKSRREKGTFVEPVFDDAPVLPDDTAEDLSNEPSAPETEKKKKPKRIAEKSEATRPGKKAMAARQQTLDLDPDAYELPAMDLLAEAPSDLVPLDKSALENNAELLETVLADFGVKGEIVEVRPGPVVTLYELEPAPGTKTSRVVGLADDIARSMSARSVRIAVVPGRSVIGIELPNAKRETVYLRELMESSTFEKASGNLNMALGKDIGGEPILADLSRMPHLLVAGTTGSGKSVGVNTMILSLLYALTPEQCKFIMIDPKMLELSIYDDIPHLLTPVVTEPGKAVMALKWAVQEMNERYRLMSNLQVRNIGGYNARLEQARKKGEQLTRTVQTGFDPDTGKPVFEDQPLDMNAMPFIVIIVDEFADLMLSVGKELDACIQSLAQKARAAGIHLIMATQRPSVDVMTGTIKANFPSRISFQVTTKIDSRTILETQGAEQLLGMGDMLFKPGGGQITRVHGPFVSDEEVEEVVTHLKKQGQPEYLDAVTEEPEEPIEGLMLSPGAVGGNTDSGDALYDQAVAIVIREKKASTSFIQRHLSIGYNRAARLIDKMEDEGIISKADRVGRRQVLAGQDGVD